jgi:hypothetical protein
MRLPPRANGLCRPVTMRPMKTPPMGLSARLARSAGWRGVRAGDQGRQASNACHKTAWSQPVHPLLPRRLCEGLPQRGSDALAVGVFNEEKTSSSPRIAKSSLTSLLKRRCLSGCARCAGLSAQCANIWREGLSPRAIDHLPCETVLTGGRPMLAGYWLCGACLHLRTKIQTAGFSKQDDKVA